MIKPSGQLLRVLGIPFGWAVIVGNTIGAGILRAPGEVARSVPSYTMFFVLWVAAGVYAMLGALSLAELGTMVPESGGQTVFVRRAFGRYPGFAVAWSDWLSTCASVAAVTIVLVDALTSLVPALGSAHSVIGAAIVLFFAAAQWSGIKTGSGIQIVTSVLKALAFIALIVACFLIKAPEQAVRASTVGVVTFAGIIVALQALIYTYDGWNGILYFSGEVTNPKDDIPRSIFSGVISVIVIYLLLNVGFLRLIPLRAMAGDPMVADTASKLVFGTIGSTVIRVLIAVSLLSAINALILMASRIFYAMGARQVNVGGTPTTALMVSTVVAVGFVMTGAFNTVAAIAAFFFVINYTASFSAVFHLRRREPDAPRPYRAWGYPYTTAIVLLGSIAFLIASVIADPRHSAYAIALLIASYPLHRWIERA
jgi:basic amino acid/polyamine antiporter, APA family